MSIAYPGITHCPIHHCEIPMDTLVCPKCKEEREAKKQQEQLEEFRKLIRQEIGNYFHEEEKEKIRITRGSLL